jgi:hypothetical protein
VRQLYKLRFTHLGDVISKSSAHLNLEHDEQRMHDLIIGAMAEAGHRAKDIGEWRMEVCEFDGGRVLHRYATTAEPGDEDRLG